jgi:hypothetical protein
MTRAQASRSLINREFPHRVLIPADNVRGRILGQVHTFHANRGAPVRCHSLRQDDKWYSAYCFAERGTAEQFQILFGGALANTQ